MISWHRLFGLALVDLFTDTAYKVELEKDLSIKQQFLDVVIIEKNKEMTTQALPDGLENLAEHNLLTYKSHQESLNEWALQELIGHYVNYRKQISPSVSKLISSENFRLYAVSTRYPRKLLNQIEQENFKQGYVDLYFKELKIRIIVLSRMPECKRNAFWQLFSARINKVAYGTKHYPWRDTTISSVMNKLYEQYKQEGLIMPYTKEDYLKSRDHLDVVDEWFARLSLEQILSKIKLEDLLANVKPEERLAGMNLEERLMGVNPKQLLAKMKPEERLAGLKPEEIRAYLNGLEEKEDKKH